MKIPGILESTIGHSEGGGIMEFFTLHNTIITLGIVTYIFMAITVISGFKRVKLKYHRILAIISIALATAHGGLVIVFY